MKIRLMHFGAELYTMYLISINNIMIGQCAQWGGYVKTSLEIVSKMSFIKKTIFKINKMEDFKEILI